MSQVRVVKVFSETNSSTTNAGGQPTATGPSPGDRTERKEYHSFAELPPETKKYIDELLGPDASTKFDNISVVSEQTTRLACNVSNYTINVAPGGEFSRESARRPA